jgi:hypothetical protein
VRHVLLALGAVVGCGGDQVDIGGFYQVDTHGLNVTSCANAPPLGLNEWLRFTSAGSGSDRTFTYVLCDDETETNCAMPPNLVYSDEVENGWGTSFPGAEPNDPMCTLKWTTSFAVYTTPDTVLRVQTREFADTTPRPEAECTQAMAESLGETMPCVSLEIIDATKL